MILANYMEYVFNSAPNRRLLPSPTPPFPPANCFNIVLKYKYFIFKQLKYSILKLTIKSCRDH